MKKKMEPNYTKLTIVIDYSLSELKDKYRQFFGHKKTKKVTILDISTWLGSLAKADIDDIDGDDTDDEVN